MLAKMTAKNQVTLPKRVVSSFKNVEYFEVTEENGRIILTPFRKSRADEVRSSLAALGITEQDVEAAVDWARKAS